jgi:acyl carrier protein
MNNNYNNIAHLFERLAQLSPEKIQLLELLIQQDRDKLENSLDSLSNGIDQQIQSYKLNWCHFSGTEQQVAKTTGVWLIFADDRGIGKELAQKLESQGDRCVMVFPGSTYERLSETSFTVDPAQPQHFQQLLSDGGIAYSNVVHLWNLDETMTGDMSLETLSQAQIKGCASVFHLVRSLVATNSSRLPKLWLVTRGAVSVGEKAEAVQVQSAPIWGLGRTIALEHPELQCTCLDLGLDGREIEFLSRQLSISSPESQIAQRQGQTYTARLELSGGEKSQNKLSITENSSYLVTGGLGGLGIKSAQWLVEKGARHLVLVGRSEAFESARAAIARMEAKGAQITVFQADISILSQTKAVVDKIQAVLPPLKGIIHAAGILDDGILTQLDWKRFEKVMSVKMGGAWHLHQLTQNLPLDFFVCFSSITSVLGNAGQANYAAANAFLDGLAYYRRSLGLPGLTLNWGPWGEVGMAAKMGDREQTRLSNLGIRPIVPESGMSILGEAIAQSDPQIAVIDINWAKFCQQFASGSHPSLVSNLLSQALPKSQGSNVIQSVESIKRQLPEVSLEQRQHLLVGYLQNTIGQYLGYDPSMPPDADRSLNELGLDSLTSIQLRNKVKSELQIDLPVAKFMGETNIELLAKNLQEQFTLGSLLATPAPTDSSTEEEEIEEITI